MCVRETVENDDVCVCVHLCFHGGILPAFALPQTLGPPSLQDLTPEALLRVKPGGGGERDWEKEVKTDR